MISKSYGWRPGVPDHRRIRYAPPLMVDLPSQVDLRSSCPAVYNQGSLGSCTAQAVAGLVQFLMIKNEQNIYTPSRLFIYYCERVIEGTVSEDAGASIATGMRVINRVGCPRESLWWYNPPKFRVRPNMAVYSAAALNRHHKYASLDNQDIQQLLTCLAQGVPFVFGFAVFDQFESREVETTGMLGMPARNEHLLGGHAVMAVGYDLLSKRLLVRNSWGSQWGVGGYFTMPFDYVTNLDLADDFWTITG